MVLYIKHINFESYSGLHSIQKFTGNLFLKKKIKEGNKCNKIHFLFIFYQLRLDI